MNGRKSKELKRLFLLSMVMPRRVAWRRLKRLYDRLPRPKPTGPRLAAWVQSFVDRSAPAAMRTRRRRLLPFLRA